MKYSGGAVARLFGEFLSLEGSMEEQIRLAAFEWLEKQVQIYGSILPRAILEQGFNFQDNRITMMGPQGIWKPQVLKGIPLSITTVAGGPYSDVFTEDGLLLYKYRGTDPFHRDNIGLRDAMSREIPLIYFHGVAKGKYLAVWPVYIVADNPNSYTFTVAADDMSSVIYNKTPEDVLYKASEETKIIKRQYITSAVRVRMHQSSFREIVIQAYRERCAFCNLHHPELLDAAHIIPDSDVLGEPIVNNGLSLCKIHHAAYDMNIVGVTPDYRIEVRNDILDEKDGPMLKYGIQALHNSNIILPNSKASWPDKEKLALRFDRFRKTG
jgi:putative restriction endonuclease